MRMRVCIVAFIGISLPACGDDPADLDVEPVGTPVGIVMGPLQAAMGVGDSIAFSAVAVDSAGGPTRHRLTWTSSDPSVATVNERGVVKALRPGAVTVSASVNTISKRANVSVFVVRPA